MGSHEWLIRPVLVVGIHRSGTKWLSNEIAAHPDAIAVQAADHGGILESNMLTQFGRGFDCDTDPGYQALIDFWSRTHFFELAAGDPQELLELEPRPADSIEAFRYLMERLARREGKHYWVQKIAPADASPVLDRFDDAVVIVIKRSPVDTARSKIRLDADRGVRTGAFRSGMSLGTQERKLNRVLRRDGVLLIHYEDLVQDRKGTMQRVFRHIGLEPADTSSPFSPNTSFKDRSERKRTLNWSDEMVVRFALRLCRILPAPILEALQRRLTSGRPDVIPGTFLNRAQPDDLPR
jgi:hypothetical protein